MQVGGAGQRSRQQLQDDVLALIQARAAALHDAGGALAANAKPTSAGHADAPAQTGRAVARINEKLALLATNLHFEVDPESGLTIVQVIDRDNGEVLRQIPSEAVVQVARSLDKLVGHLLDDRA